MNKFHKENLDLGVIVHKPEEKILPDIMFKKSDEATHLSKKFKFYCSFGFGE